MNVKNTLRHPLFPVLLVGLIFLSIPVCVGIGSTFIAPMDTFSILLHKVFDFPLHRNTPTNMQAIVWELRLPRVLLACIAGAALAMSGLTLQCITRNALADPHILGVTSGAVFGAVIVTLHTGEFLGSTTLPFIAFLGAFTAAIIILLLCQSDRFKHAPQLLMCGVSLGFVFMALANFALYLGDIRATHQAIFWIFGGLGLARWSYLWIPYFTVFICFIGLVKHSQAMNALLLGDITASSTGIPVKRVRLQLFSISALLTAVTVSLTGAIGFIGLMIPHIARIMVGGDHWRLNFTVPFFGALFLLWLDALSRTLVTATEIPVGILSGFIGGLFFLILLLRH
ncbi:MAG: iron ABC transporter permease [Cellvibrionales bacterium]|nr:iron ABC transporter permease [Cellvibrionales bacterium]